MRRNSYCNSGNSTYNGESNSAASGPSRRIITGVLLSGKEYGSYPEPA